ncbi:hypothetical protein NUH87_17720 [Pseudomonas batumici]|uniref:hypothetical protein n=1 Tax=Pseudomonas batumici TaxID=226910 RepID=UPI0030D0A844
MQKLEEDYPGDTGWQALVALYEEDYLDDQARQLAAVMNEHLDMAVILYGKRGLDEGLWWLEQQVPALDDLKPMECLHDPILIRRLRTVLMRMP